jgi:prefoldin subunit 5
MREQLGARLETAAIESLRRRIDELTESNNRYCSETVRLATELNEVRGQLQIMEDDLAGARASIRRLIRAETSEVAT